MAQQYGGDPAPNATGSNTWGWTPAPTPGFFIECVITCVDNADFLAHTLPNNYHLFDHFLVVTAPEDKPTKRVCDNYGVRYVETDVFRSRWGEFCKGAGINVGLSALDKKGWLVHMDADVILPSHFRKILQNADLDKSMIYGIDRFQFQSYEDWQRFYGTPEPQVQGNGVFVHTTHVGQHIAMGTRVMFEARGGYVPIGFFQLWNVASGILKYPEGHSTAGREDSLFGALWPRSKRGFIPEVIAFHLESEQAPMAVNWSGRKTKQFHIDGNTK